MTIKISLQFAKCFGIERNININSNAFKGFVYGYCLYSNPGNNNSRCKAWNPKCCQA